MLERITISNLALISDAELTFSDKLNILSGETGAGKSIIVDALMLLMGGKYDKTMLSYGAESGFVEGLFSFDETKTEFLPEYGIDADAELIVNRKFYSDGKNDIRVNGKSVTAKMLKAIMSHFVDICGQNEYQVLANKREHASILDAYLSDELAPALGEAEALFAEYTDAKKKMALIGNTEQRLQRIDILTYQINEIDRANIREGEEEELTEYRNRAMHSEKIKLALGGATDELTRDGGCVDSLYAVLKSVGSIADISAEYGDINARLNAIAVELDDISGTVSSLLSDVDFNEADLENAESRLQQIRAIRKKYGDLAELPDKYKKMCAELQILQNSDEEYEYLCETKKKLLGKLYDVCKEVSAIRKKGALGLEEDVKRELSALGMKNAEFKVSFADYPSETDFEKTVSANGADDIEFLLSPNIGQPLLPLIKIISGGEMSRFMLALKVITSKYGELDTMIFDEIDTGISGKIGQEVAKKLADISRSSQVLCVTHLPQIAAMADFQYYIEKSTDGKSTRTDVRCLDREGMINEISRLSGARGISSAARLSASELKDWCDSYKKSLE